MLNDYQPEISENERLKRGHRRKGRFLLVGAIIGTAVIYFAAGLMDDAAYAAFIPAWAGASTKEARGVGGTVVT